MTNPKRAATCKSVTVKLYQCPNGVRLAVTTCHEHGYFFDYIRPLTDAQLEIIRKAEKDAENRCIDFILEQSNPKGRNVRYFYDIYDYLCKKPHKRF